MIGILLGKLKWAAMMVGVGALAVIVFLIRKAGADAEKFKQAKADLRANAEITKSRTAARSASDDDLNSKVEKWTRK